MARPTLHEELARLLQEQQDWSTTTELADKVNVAGRYKKGNGTAVTAFQIHGRTRQYSEMFERDGSRVRLRRPRSPLE